jgi:hypothetical protein
MLDVSSIVDKRSPYKRPVRVVDARELTAWLTSQPRQLSDTTLALIKLAADEPETWHVDPRAADTLRVMQRFERLADQVGMPAAPAHAPSRTQAQPRASRQAASRGYAASRRAPARSSGRTTSSFGDLLKLWFAVALIISAILIIRGMANQPCTSPVACMLPPIYLVFKPLLVVGAIGSIGFGVVGTLVWFVRRVMR